MTDASDLDAVAAELYSGPPDAFIATRNARAKGAGDAELAAAIRGLRKPSVAAWVVNLFAHERASRLGQALQLAAELREAQDDLDAATLSQLGRQRRALTNQLATEAASLAAAQGARVTDATREAVRQTISAAFFDPDAAAAVASGRLVRDLEPTSAFDLDDVVGGGRPGSPAPAPRGQDEVAARRDRRRAERALREAEKARERAESADRRADDEAQDAATRADRLTERIFELEQELMRAREDATRARQEAETAGDRRRQAREELSAAGKVVDEARRALAEL
ncbi:transposase [Microbacterium sp. NPDC089318]